MARGRLTYERVKPERDQRTFAQNLARFIVFAMALSWVGFMMWVAGGFLWRVFGDLIVVL